MVKLQVSQDSYLTNCSELEYIHVYYNSSKEENKHYEAYPPLKNPFLNTVPYSIMFHVTPFRDQVIENYKSIID